MPGWPIYDEKRFLARRSGQIRPEAVATLSRSVASPQRVVTDRQ